MSKIKPTEMERNESKIMVWRAHTFGTHRGCIGRIPFCCIKFKQHQSFGIKWDEDYDENLNPHRGRCQHNKLPLEVEQAGYTNEDLKVFIDKLYSVMEMYTSDDCSASFLFCMPFAICENYIMATELAKVESRKIRK